MHVIYYLLEETLARFRCQVEEAQQELWVLLLSSITQKTSVTHIWVKIKTIVGKFGPSSSTILEVNGSYISDLKIVNNICYNPCSIEISSPPSDFACFLWAES